MEYDQTLKKLGEQVNSFTKDSTPLNNFNTSSTQSKIGKKFSFSKIYFAIPVVVAILLLILKPGFLKTEVIEQQSNGITLNIKKFSITKFLIWTCVFSLVILLGIFGYFYKQF